jgi:hypothetical protein
MSIYRYANEIFESNANVLLITIEELYWVLPIILSLLGNLDVNV